MRLAWGVLSVSFLLAPAAAMPARADDAPVEQQLVDVMNKLFGTHPGFRANHAKGIVVDGTFAAAPEAQSISKAAHFVPGTTVPVVARFSDATGVPNISDGDADANPHGLAVKFHLPDGSDTDFVVNSLKTFPVATGEEFLQLLQAAAASPPDSAKPSKLDAFVAAHPSVPRAVGAVHTPASYATEEYNGIDAFIFTNKAGADVATRYKVVPLTGVQYLSSEQAKAKAADYLATELAERLKQGPVAFQVLVQVAERNDPTADPTIAWPDDRTRVPLGILTLTKIRPDSDEAQKSLLFLPGALTDGIAPSDDPLIQTRNGSYGVSFARRSAP